MNDDELPERYAERAAATLAYRLMERLESLGVLTNDHVCYLRWPPIELIEDAEKALKDETDKEELTDRLIALTDVRVEYADRLRADLIDRLHAAWNTHQPQTDALKMARDALERIASIKADDGDNFSAWPDNVIIRCEITVADLNAIRAALDADGFKIREKGQ
jgi:hypothetical protein